MGKTKTAFISGGEEEKKTSQQKYAEKIAKKKALDEGINTEEGVQSDTQESTTSVSPTHTVKSTNKSKKYIESKAKIDKNKEYTLNEAIKIIKQISYSKFDGTMEMHLVVKKLSTSTQVTLPHSFGKSKKVVVADDKTIAELEKNEINFDILLATPEMMPKLVKFARSLGPKGLMPNPKNGTVIKSVKDAEKFSANTLNLKTEKEAPLIHTSFGKVSMEDKLLIENAEVILKALDANKQIIKAFIKATMSPSVKLAF